MITLGAPLFAWLLPLALLPVAFHLFFRIRKQPREVSSLLFFLAADPQLSARRRVREWLVLLLRTLALAALLLALARPLRQGWGGRDVQVLEVIDNSASMRAAGEDGQTRLSRALAAATAVLQDGTVRHAAVLTTVRDPALGLPSGFSDDLAGLRSVLGSMQATHGSSDVAGVLRQASGLAGSAMNGVTELHIFTDLQAADWGGALTPVPFPRGTPVVVHDVGRGRDQAGVVSVLPESGYRQRLVTGRPWRYVTHLRNYGSREMDVAANVALDDTRLRLTTQVGAGQTREVRFALPGLPAGEHLLRVWLDGPSAGPSADAWQVVTVAPPDDVWLVGDERDYGLLGAALAPVADGMLTGLRVKTVSGASSLVSITTSSAPVLVVAAYRYLADPVLATACHDFVTRGGTLLVCPEPQGEAGHPPVLPSWCGVAVGTETVSEKGEPLVAFAEDAALWGDLRDELGRVNLRGVQVRRWLPLQVRPSEGSVVLAGTAGGVALLTHTVVGRGLVYVSGMAWDLRWSNLPRRAVFLPLAMGFARVLQSESPAALMIQAGAAFPVDRRATTTGAVRLRSVAGDPVSWSGRAGALPVPARAGLYRVEGLAQPLTLGVAGNPVEAAPALVSARSLPVLAGVEYQTLVYHSAQETANAVQEARRGQSLFGFFLALAALFWLVELWLVNQRPAVAGKP